MKRLIIFSVLILTVQGTFSAQIKGMRLWESPDSTRVVLDVSDAVDHTVFTLSDPNRMVIDLDKSSLLFNPSEIDIQSDLVTHVRTSEGDGKVRVVLDLKKDARYNTFELKPFQNYGHRLVIDLFDKNQSEEAPKAKTTPRKNELRDIIVAIDAGHGGEDPGASGGHGTKEKDVALKVALALAKLIDKEPGMKALLVRKGDYFVSLKKRTQIARQNQADIFVSIHADGFHDKRAKGASVWVVSPKGAQSEMGRWLEERENESDLLGGVESLSDKDPLLAQVLLDLSTTYSVSASIDAANSVHHYLAKAVPKMHKDQVQRASFAVLRMPDIPAMLVEMAFISNPKEEKLLKTASHQEGIASALFLGLRQYFQLNPPHGSRYANQSPTQYTIRGGDTLSGIAQRFNVSLVSLRNANALENDSIRVGQQLTIPN